MSSTIELLPTSADVRERLHTLAARVRLLRESLRLTQDEFARRCGISVSFVSLIERGERSPSFEMLFVLAQGLEVPVAELFRANAALETRNTSNMELLEFVHRAQLTHQQIERLIAVGHAMFGLDPEQSARRTTHLAKCSVEACVRPVLAKGLCASHYHRARRSRR